MNNSYCYLQNQGPRCTCQRIIVLHLSDSFFWIVQIYLFILFILDYETLERKPNNCLPIYIHCQISQQHYKETVSQWKKMSEERNECWLTFTYLLDHFVFARLQEVVKKKKDFLSMFKDAVSNFLSLVHKT